MMLQDASVQDIQLELIRRTTYNAFDGGQVYADLMAHRELWKSAMLYRNEHGIMLYDIVDNFWNADILLILAKDEDSAIALTDIAAHWHSDGGAQIYSLEETQKAIGRWSKENERLVSLWWD